jgi:hypothetical protein
MRALIGVNGDPFRKCRDCRMRRLCRRVRQLLCRYYINQQSPRAGQIWPWEHGLCPARLLPPFEEDKECLICGGSGWVAEKKTRGTASNDGTFLLDIGLLLGRLPVMQERSVTIWILCGELEELDIREILHRIRIGRALFRKRLCSGLHQVAQDMRREQLL